MFWFQWTFSSLTEFVLKYSVLFSAIVNVVVDFFFFLIAGDNQHVLCRQR